MEPDHSLVTDLVYQDGGYEREHVMAALVQTGNDREGALAILRRTSMTTEKNAEPQFAPMPAASSPQDQTMVQNVQSVQIQSPSSVAPVGVPGPQIQQGHIQQAPPGQIPMATNITLLPSTVQNPNGYVVAVPQHFAPVHQAIHVAPGARSGMPNPVIRHVAPGAQPKFLGLERLPLKAVAAFTAFLTCLFWTLTFSEENGWFMVGFFIFLSISVSSCVGLCGTVPVNERGEATEALFCGCTQSDHEKMSIFAGVSAFVSFIILFFTWSTFFFLMFLTVSVIGCIGTCNTQQMNNQNNMHQQQQQLAGFPQQQQLAGFPQQQHHVQVVQAGHPHQAVQQGHVMQIQSEQTQHV